MPDVSHDEILVLNRLFDHVGWFSLLVERVAREQTVHGLAAEDVEILANFTQDGAIALEPRPLELEGLFDGLHLALVSFHLRVAGVEFLDGDGEFFGRLIRCHGCGYRCWVLGVAWFAFELV